MKTKHKLEHIKNPPPLECVAELFKSKKIIKPGKTTFLQPSLVSTSCAGAFSAFGEVVLGGAVEGLLFFSFLMA